jgi:phenylalanyl-tRNA synthetase beta chain
MTGVTGVVPAKKADIVPAYEKIKMFFAKNRNLMESVSFGFGNLYKEKLASDKPNVRLANPIADYMNTARNCLIPNMLDAAAENAKRGFSDLAMFEFGTVFDGPNPGEEHKQIVVARTGEAGPRHWLKRGRPVDIFDVKADLMAYFGPAKTEVDAPPMWAHPYRYGRLVRDGKTLGEFGELHPKLARHWRLKMPVVIGLIDNPESAVRPADTADESNFQPITRDFSFVLNKEIAAQDIMAAARGADPQIADVLEFDFYENSVAFAIRIEPSHNLSDADLLDIQNRVVSAVEKLGLSLRGA